MTFSRPVDLPPDDGRPSARADLQAPATQLVPDRDTYLGQGGHDVGRRISDDEVELFVGTDVAAALQQEFSSHDAEFVALHDVGGSASVKLLAGLAGAAGGRVQRLSVRRQGQGVALAMLPFVEMQLSDGTPVRVYSTDVNADSLTRTHLGRVLLGYSRLGVLLMGALPPHALTAQLAPLRAALLAEPWRNRNLLMVPLGSGTALAAQAAQLAAGSPVAVHVTPHAGKPRQAWTYIGGAWNRLHGRRAGDRALPTELALAVPKVSVPLSEAPTQVMGLEPPGGDARQAPTQPAPQATGGGSRRMGDRTAGRPVHRQSDKPADRPIDGSAPRPIDRPTDRPNAPSADAGAARPLRAPGTEPAPVPPRVAAKPAATGGHWQAYVERCAAIQGAVACCVFDVPTMQPLAHTGSLPAQRLAQQGTALLEHANDIARALALGNSGNEASISTASHHLLLRRLPGHPGVAVHLALLAGAGNLALARLQLERVELPG